MKNETFMHVGHNNYVSRKDAAAVVKVDSTPIKKLIEIAGQQGKVLDVTRGRKTRSLIMLHSGILILSSIGTPNLVGRVADCNMEERGRPRKDVKIKKKIIKKEKKKS